MDVPHAKVIIETNDTEKLDDNDTEKLDDNDTEKLDDNDTEKLDDNDTEKLDDNDTEKLYNNDTEKLYNNVKRLNKIFKMKLLAIKDTIIINLSHVLTLANYALQQINYNQSHTLYNPKTQLNAIFRFISQFFKIDLKKIKITYSCNINFINKQNKRQCQSTVILPLPFCENKAYTGLICENKKSSEHSAALTALITLSKIDTSTMLTNPEWEHSKKDLLKYNYDIKKVDKLTPIPIEWKLQLSNIKIFSQKNCKFNISSIHLYRTINIKHLESNTINL